MRIALLCIVAISLGGSTFALVDSTDPKLALKSISDYKGEQFKASYEKFQAPDMAAIDAHVKVMALEAIRNVDPASVEAKSASDWGRLFSAAGQKATAIGLFERYLTTNISDEERCKTKEHIINDEVAIGRVDEALAVLKEIKPTSFFYAASINNDLTTSLADVIQKRKGPGAAIAALDLGFSKIPHDEAHANDENYMNSGTGENALKLTVVKKKFSLLKEPVRKPRPLKS